MSRKEQKQNKGKYVNQEKSVLIVEDDTDLLEIITRRLKQFGYRSFGITKGKDAISQITESPPDLLLLDQFLQDTNAQQIVSSLRERHIDIPFIIMTGKGDEKLAVDMMKLGAEDYLVKSGGFLERIPIVIKSAFQRLQKAEALRIAEENLRENEKKFRDLYENAPLGYQSLDENGMIIEVNRAWSNFFGYSKDEVIGKPFESFLSKNQRCEFNDFFNKFKINKEIHDVELEMKKKDGSEVVVSFDGRICYDKQGEMRTHCILHDITHRKRAEQAVEHAAIEWRTTFDSAMDGICLLDRDQKIKRCNKAMSRILGKDFDEIIGLHCWEIMHGTSKPIPECPIDRMKKSLQRESMELNLKQQSFKITVDPIQDQNGSLIGIVHIMRDITEQKKTEKERERLLHETKERIKELRCMYEVAESIRKQDTLDELFTELVALIPSGWHYPKITRGKIRFDGREYVSEPFEETEWSQSGDIVIEGKKRGMVEVYFLEKRPEQEEGPFLKNERDLINGIAHALSEAIERKQAEKALRNSEERFRALVESSFDHIFMLNRDGIYMTSNNRVGQFELESGESLVGRHLRDVYPPEVAEFYQKQLEHVFATGQAVDFEHQMIEHDNEHYHLDTLYPIYRDSEIWAIGGICRDITGRKKAEIDLNRSQQQLRNLASHLQTVREEEKMNISNEIHDKLGQSLTALKMDLTWLKKNIPQENEKLYQKIQSMIDFTDDIIKIGKRITADLRPGVLDDLGLAAAIEWEVDEFKERTQINCELSLEENIQLDSDRSIALFRIVQESLTNIIRHANATHVKIVLKKKKNDVMLEIKDNGKGITRKQVENSRAFGIIGMKERLYPFNGRFTISGKRNQGTTVRAVLPIQGEEADHAKNINR